MALGKQGQITAEEAGELERLIGLVDHQMRLRSQALLLLKRRGHNIEQLRRQIRERQGKGWHSLDVVGLLWSIRDGED